MTGRSVRTLVRQYTDSRDLAVLGEPGVNVVQLNLALDEIVKGAKIMDFMYLGILARCICGNLRVAQIV